MYDAILEILHGVWKNGFSLTALGTAVFVLLKQRKVKKRLRRYIPWLLEDDSEVKEFIHNQHLIMERLGIPFAPTLQQDSLPTAKKKRELLSSHSEELSVAPGAGPYTNWRLMKLKNKFKSRKFILAVVGAALIIANDGLDLGIDQDTVLAFAGLLATWIVGESAVDARRVRKEQSNEKPTASTEHFE